MENNQKEKENIENMKEQNVVPNNDPVFNEIQEILMDQEMIQKKLIENNNKNSFNTISNSARQIKVDKISNIANNSKKI